MLIHALTCDADHTWSHKIARPWASIVYMLLDGYPIERGFVPNFPSYLIDVHFGRPDLVNS